jgi:hypothetical protein
MVQNKVTFRGKQVDSNSLQDLFLDLSKVTLGNFKVILKYFGR